MLPTEGQLCKVYILSEPQEGTIQNTFAPTVNYTY